MVTLLKAGADKFTGIFKKKEPTVQTEYNMLGVTQDLDESIEPSTTPEVSKGRKILGKVTFGLIGNKDKSDQHNDDDSVGGSFID